MSARHLIISDLHENHGALRRFIKAAEHTPGGFNDIWFLGDIFGHSFESIGKSNLTEDFFESIRILSDYPYLAVFGNWEYWLGHPEADQRDKNQREHEFQLKQRRLVLGKKGNGRILDRFLQNASLVYPAGRDAEFTLFHGCSYECHGNSDYHPKPWECYLYPRDLNIVTRGLFGNRDHLATPHFLFGHTHTPGWFAYSGSTMINMWRYFTPEQAGEDICYGGGNLRFGINPGSAGVEGKNMPRTAVLLDSNEKLFRYLTDTE